MSKTEAPLPEEFDFWEFVCCGLCHLPFSTDVGAPPPAPFWITECGHVVCNSHLKADQSCAKCGAQDIQVAPLQREMAQPMANWFTTVTQSFDSMAYAARFQFDQLASSVRYYRRKCSQQRVLIEKMRNDVQSHSALRRTVEELQGENRRLRERIGEPSSAPNANGKRRMHDFNRNAFSSPRSVATPVGPDRLTLPPSHQQPTFSGQHHSDDGPRLQVDTRPPEAGYTPLRERPGSRHFTEQYSYLPTAQTQKVPPAPLSHAQAHPIRQAQDRRHHAQDQNSTHTLMPPPAQHSSKFKPSCYRPQAHGQDIQHEILPPQDPRRASDMPPPPVPPGSTASGPHRHGQLVKDTMMLPPNPRGLQRFPSSDTGGFTSRMSTPAPQMLPTQRFVPATPSGRQRPLAPTPVPAGGSVSSLLMRQPGSRREPFIPGGSSLFDQE